VNTPNGNYVIGGGKEGNLFLLNQANLGHYGANANPVNSNAAQILNVGNSIYSTSAFWNSSLYLAPAGGNLQAYSFNSGTGLFNTAAASQSGASFDFPGATPSVSSNGASNGIAWANDSSQYCTPYSPGCAPAILYAFDATNLANELWDSTQVAGDAAGNAVKFTVPTVANGKVYIGTRGSDVNNGGIGELDVYGLKPN